jgi:DNA-binding transcriptional ArsR family regulator
MLENEILKEILYNLREINVKLDRLLSKGEVSPFPSENMNVNNSLDVMMLLSLPDHLRTTATTLFEIGPATAEDIAEVTRKERAVESNYLNQLVRMEHVEKYREGRKVYFHINSNMC